MIDETKELLIQKCVDGELSVEAQQELLAQLDVITEGWKILALAYVEEQSWNVSFLESNRIARHMEDESLAQHRNAFIDSAVMESSAMMEGQQIQCFMPPTANSTADSDKRSRLLTQATCLAIALVGGILIGDVWRSRLTAENKVVDNEKIDTSIRGLGNHSNGSEAVTVVRGQNGGVSAYPLEQFDRDPEPQLDEFLDHEDLLRLGVQLDQDQRWFFLQLEDGRRALMPVKSWNIQPIGQ